MAETATGGSIVNATQRRTDHRLRNARKWIREIRNALDLHQKTIAHTASLNASSQYEITRLLCRHLVRDHRVHARQVAASMALEVVKLAVWIATPIIMWRSAHWKPLESATSIWYFTYYIVTSLLILLLLKDAPVGGRRIARMVVFTGIVWSYSLYVLPLITPYLEGTVFDILPDDPAQISAIPTAFTTMLAGAVATPLMLTASRAILEPRLIRRIGTVPPPHAAALVLLRLLTLLYVFDSWWLRSGQRHIIAKQFRRRERDIESILVAAARGSGGLRDDIRRARIDALHVRAALRNYRHRIVEAYSTDDCRNLVDDMAADMDRLANGDWSTIRLSRHVGLTSRFRSLANRLVAPVLLVATALGLNIMPGITAVGPGLRSIQIGLLAAAALSLVPADSRTASSILSSLKDATKR